MLERGNALVPVVVVPTVVVEIVEVLLPRVLVVRISPLMDSNHYPHNSLQPLPDLVISTSALPLFVV